MGARSQRRSTARRARASKPAPIMTICGGHSLTLFSHSLHALERCSGVTQGGAARGAACRGRSSGRSSCRMPRLSTASRTNSSKKRVRTCVGAVVTGRRFARGAGRRSGRHAPQSVQALPQASPWQRPAWRGTRPARACRGVSDGPPAPSATSKSGAPLGRPGLAVARRSTAGCRCGTSVTEGHGGGGAHFCELGRVGVVHVRVIHGRDLRAQRWAVGGYASRGAGAPPPLSGGRGSAAVRVRW